MGLSVFCCVLIAVLHGKVLTADALVTQGENAADFAAVCSLIQFAKAAAKDFEAPPEINQIIDTLSAINFTLLDDNIRATVEQNKGKPWDAIAAQHQGPTKYYGDHWEQWKRVANLQATDPERKALADWEKHRANENLKRQVKYLLEEAVGLKETATTNIEELKSDALKRHQTEALYGSAGVAGEIKSGSDRETFCGKGSNGNNAAGEGATESLYGTLLCLCAGATTDTTAGLGCCLNCQQAPNSGAWTVTNNGRQIATYLANKCPKYLIPEEPTTAELNHRLAAFNARITVNPSTTQTMDYVIGKVSGMGADGCTGVVGGNTGRCAKFTKAQITGTDAALKWKKALKAAADAFETQKKAANKLDMVAAKIKLINTTAAALLYTPIPTAMKDVGTPTETKHTPGSVCFTQKTNATCRTDNNCKWDSTTEEKGNHCKPKTETTTTAAGTGEEEADGVAKTRSKLL
uniref:Variant surface glycoprotein 1187 n=1 Tax=Trypanosoma brucei TaxID=5691 RepID=M4TB02_9TRYP|nr:variant surface glycoprotein 1187 [Trypanosoma brucei]